MSNVKYDPELCERLVREARELCEGFRFRVGEPSAAIDAHRHIRAMADQLEAARREVERLRNAGVNAAGSSLLVRLEQLAGQARADGACMSDPVLTTTPERSGRVTWTLPPGMHDSVIRLRNALPAIVSTMDEARSAIESYRFTVRNLERDHISSIGERDELAAERDAMRPVVDAAEVWRDVETDDHGNCDDTVECDHLMRAIDAYRAAKGKT